MAAQSSDPPTTATTATFNADQSSLTSASATTADMWGLEGNYTDHNSTGMFGNMSGQYDVHIWAMEQHTWAIAVPVVFGLIFVVGLIGNGTLIFIVAMNKVMRNVPNILIVSLSLGDFLLILISVPLTSTVYTFINWPYGLAACKFNFFMQTWSLGVTVFTLMALSHDRYTAIMDPMSKHKGKTQTQTLCVSAMIWIVSFLLSLSDLILSNEVIKVSQTGFRVRICFPVPGGPDDLLPRVYYALRFVIFFAIPVIVISMFYLMMARILIRSGEQMPCEGKSGGLNQQRQIAARKKVARVVLTFVFIFILCWLPRHVYLLWYYFDDANYNEFWHYFKIVGFCLSFINSCINPFALYFLSSHFRKYYDRYLFCCFKRVIYTRMEPSSTMHNFNSTVRRASSTQTSIVQSQSMC